MLTVDSIRHYDEDYMRENAIYFSFPNKDYGFLSHNYQSTFYSQGVQYKTLEHFIRAQKAKICGDKKAFSKIVKANTAQEAYVISKNIKIKSREHFKLWEDSFEDIITVGNIIKFGNKYGGEIRERLISTGNKILVYSVLYNYNLATGISPNDSNKYNISKWNGKNLLGFVLMYVRETINGIDALDICLFKESLNNDLYSKET